MKHHFLTFLFSLIVSLSAFSQKKKIKDFSIVYDNNATFAPGSIIRVGVKVVWKDNSVKMTQGLLNGKISWDKFNVIADGALAFTNGSLLVKDDIENRNNIVTLIISPKEDSSFKKSIDIKINYKGRFFINHSGLNGRDGRDGQNGSHGCRNNNGGHGNHGTNGENGGDAESLDVFVKLVKEDSANEYLKIMVYNLNTQWKTYYKINASGGSFVIAARGGDGGKGGDGGSGGDGIDRGEGGDGGDGAYGGNGGKGGQVRIFFEGDAANFKSSFIVNNGGGQGGKGGSKGYKGSPGKGFQVEKHKTLVGTLLADQGYGRSGVKGQDGYNGQAGPIPEFVLLQVLEYEW